MFNGITVHSRSLCFNRSFITAVECMNAGGHQFSSTMSSLTNWCVWVNKAHSTYLPLNTAYIIPFANMNRKKSL